MFGKASERVLIHNKIILAYSRRKIALAKVGWDRSRIVYTSNRPFTRRGRYGRNIIIYSTLENIKNSSLGLDGWARWGSLFEHVAKNMTYIICKQNWASLECAEYYSKMAAEERRERYRVVSRGWVRNT